MKVKSESKVTQSRPTLSDPMDYSLPGSSIHGIFQARVLEWVATEPLLQSAGLGGARGWISQLAADGGAVRNQEERIIYEG